MKFVMTFPFFHLQCLSHNNRSKQFSKQNQKIIKLGLINLNQVSQISFKLLLLNQLGKKMRINLITSQALNEQAKFNSFILCQTKNIPLSEKLPFIVTTKKNKITKPSQNQENDEDFQCNYSFDCVNYYINGKNIILAEGSWLKPLLTSKQINHLETYQIVNFESLQLRTNLKFYIYQQNSNVFLQIIPNYLITHNCLVFEDLNHISGIEYKNVYLADIQRQLKQYINDQNHLEHQFYTFQSQYAIMSDMHFLGSFVRGFKSIGSYMKKSQKKEYVHIMEQKLLRNLKRLYPSPNL